MHLRLHLSLAVALAWAQSAGAHGTLVNGRMFQVRVAGPNGHTPAAWSESYYTWNQDSHNFPDYAAAGFSYAKTVPDGTITYAGINDGVQTGLNFKSLETPSANWGASAAAAGQSFALHWVATAPHDPSFFQVYLTTQDYDAATQKLSWSKLENLGRWALNDATHPVTNATAPSPAGGNTLSYDWTIPVPADRSGHHVVVVIWQRQDPAGEAFFSVQDLQVAPAAASTLGVTRALDRTVHLAIHGTPNQTWAVQKTDSLATGAWTTLATGTTDSLGSLEAVDPDTTAAARFYRGVSPPP